jgi:serine/threonine protein kinase
MSEATVESAYSEPENHVSSESETAPARSGNEIILASRYVIQPDVILPHLSTHSAKAYAAIDTEDFSNALYALVLDQTIPARLPAIVNSKNVVHDALIRPVRWGRVAWGNTGREEIVIVLPQPAGPPLFLSMEATVQPWLVREIKRDFLTPILDLLKRMHDERVSHRNLRPTNLFRKQDDGTLQSGQIYSAPPGFDQPTIFEPIERARCIPTGRGIGDMADDMYAIGATILLLTLGRNPVAGIDEKELLQRRI